MSNEAPVTIEYKCWGDCEPYGCPGHKITAHFSNTSDVLRIDKDGKPILYADPNMWAAIANAAASILGNGAR